LARHIHDQHTCKLCQCLLYDGNDLNAHMAKAHPKSLTCPRCRAVSAGNSEFEEHLARCVGNPSYPGDAPELRCPLCSKAFQTAAATETHARECGAHQPSEWSSLGFGKRKRSPEETPPAGLEVVDLTQDDDEVECVAVMAAPNGAAHYQRGGSASTSEQCGADVHRAVSPEWLRVHMVPRGGEMVLCVVLNGELAVRRRRASVEWAALPPKERVAVRVIRADDCPCACRDEDESDWCRCAQSLSSAIRARGLRDASRGIVADNLAEVLDAEAGACRVARVAMDDPRVALRGQRCLVAGRRFTAGDVITVYQGVLLSQYRFDEMRLRGVRLANKGGDELAFPLKQCRHLDAYAHQLDRYNATLDELEYTTENRLILHAFRCGNEAAFANDPAINIDELDEMWDRAQLNAGQLHLSGVTVVPHNHPPHGFGNCMLQEYSVCGWPFVFLTATAHIPRDAELMVQYGFDYWSARKED